MAGIAIGVHVHSQPKRLAATLEAIGRYTPLLHECIVIPDGADDATARALPYLAGVRVLEDVGACGGAACLNRLFRATDAGIVILLESGCRPAPGWLEAIVAALDSSPTAGLAGPSTNRSWNEQAVFPGASGTDTALASTAAHAQRRFGASCRTLAPLFSLADFCYAVRREVFDTIGEADESYGLGPCWEMDFNIRAARTGFDGLWVCSAYVWRAPVTARRQREETARFQASRRRYQDKFCGGRLRGIKHDYRRRCRGDCCPNFAPAHLIGVRGLRPPQAASAGPPTAPLVTCIMPTADRRSFIPQALECFLAQDYPNLELLVVDDGRDPVADMLPTDERITYIRLDNRLSVGAKRNLACERARGHFIVHWDDDDWYPASRVRVQIRALLEHGADVCGTSTLHYYDRDRNLAFRYCCDGSGRPWVAGNTLAYRREAWRQRPFADVQVGEDALFLWSRGNRLVDLHDPALCVAAVHAANVSPKYTSGPYWRPENVEVVRHLMGDACPAAALANAPLVSCIMPTCDRRAFIGLALACFRGQTYPNRELIVVDDGKDSIGELVRDEPGVKYVRIARHLPIGAKRNLACAEARGDIVAHWDDDDWYSADRLERQVAPLVRGDADMTGLDNRFVLQAPDRTFWTVDPGLHRAMFVGDVHGGTLVFRRSIWTSGIRYPEVDLAEDAVLLSQAASRGHRLLKVENRGSFVYVRHSKNAWRFKTGSFLDPTAWHHSAAPAEFTSETLDAYAAAASLMRP
jgi:glycosyltransferase involved in cell wall biosynthesis/GT2 family glycosyltransferase